MPDDDRETHRALREIAAFGTAHVEAAVVAGFVHDGLIERPSLGFGGVGYRPWCLTPAGEERLAALNLEHARAVATPDRQVLPLSRRRDRDVPF